MTGNWKIVFALARRELRGRDSTPTLVDHLGHRDMAVRIAAAGASS